ncbi:hypothetical protein OG616_01755 [Streptomyces antibioticus]|uniref:hypothetical protein n=1 Tax=Streptomyces antibioticus TaxID=1890 RepID=UPI002252DCF5|nr:hypothetical protein [Streptomyces antibioticus]MCX5166739.1 hypothetical protein [Streptomyces antibioticus]
MPGRGGRPWAADRDSQLLRAAAPRPGQDTASYVPPTAATAAVVRRMADDRGDLVWMPDGRTYCSAIVRHDMSSMRCGPQLPPPQSPLTLTSPRTHPPPTR